MQYDPTDVLMSLSRLGDAERAELIRTLPDDLFADTLTRADELAGEASRKEQDAYAQHQLAKLRREQAVRAHDALALDNRRRRERVAA